MQQLIEQSAPARHVPLVRFWGPRAIWLFYLAILMFWLHDTSENKADTLALLDRSLTIGVRLLLDGRSA